MQLCEVSVNGKNQFFFFHKNWMILLLSEQNSSEKIDTEKYISHITGKLSKSNITGEEELFS